MILPLLPDDREGCEAHGDECKPEPVLNFAFQTVKSFFYVHSTGEYDENILNMESVWPET
jgi:hypothetical protein